MKKGWKILIVMLVVLVIVGSGVYFLLFSPRLANDARLMKLRYQYSQAVSEADVLTPEIMVSNEDPETKGLYWYYVNGKVERVSADSLYLRVKGGGLYRFFVDWKQMGNGYVQHAVRNIKNWKTNEFEWGWVTFNTEDLHKSGDLNHEAYDPDQEYRIVWSDNRTLSEIIAMHKANPDEIMNTNKQMKYLFRYE